MKAEERKHLKENEFQEWLARSWRAITSGSTANTIVWSAILVVLLGLIGWKYYSSASLLSRSELWYDLDKANTIDALNKIIKENKDKAVTRVARFHLARYEMQDALTRLAGPILDDRRKAAKDLEDARDAYRDLAKETSGDATLAEESLMNVAKAEETLAAVPKADNESEMRGSLAQAVALYQDVAKRFPESFLGKQAAARAKEIDDHRTQFEAFCIALSKEFGKKEMAKPDLKGPELPMPPETPKADGKPPESSPPKN